ncbi:MAG: type II secretion system protein GspM [Burkholderiaceae bacterium]|nr:type II secretion system protein GspM [Burkholderiaceae bacterium]
MRGFSNSRIALPLSAGDAIDHWTAPWRARWRALGERERRGLAIAAWVLFLFLFWALAIAPAWRTARATPAQLDQLDAQLQQMQRQANEARELRAIPALGSTQAAAALRAASDGLGSAGRLQLSGDRATLTLTGASGAQLRDWLVEARSAARARPLEANLARGPQGYSGSIVLALPSGSGQ